MEKTQHNWCYLAHDAARLLVRKWKNPTIETGNQRGNPLYVCPLYMPPVQLPYL